MSVLLRAIEEADLERIMNWRMEPEITRYMNTDPKLTLSGQREWLKGVRSNEDVRYWLIEIEDTAAGVINITGLTNPEGRIGWAYYVGEKKLRSIKTAMALEMSLYDYVFCELNKKVLVSDVFTLNQGVIQLHLLCGSEIVEEKRAYVCKGGVSYDVTFMEMRAEKWEKIRSEKKYDRIRFPV